MEEGLDATLFFVIQMENICAMSPNDRTHPAFGAALREAAAAGVQICARMCAVEPDTLAIAGPGTGDFVNVYGEMIWESRSCF